MMKKSLCHLMIGLVLLLLQGLGSQAWAATNCRPTAGLPGILNVGSVKVASNLPAGQIIPGTLKPFSISGSCVLGSGGAPPNNVQVGSKIVACNFTSANEVMPGVYSTSMSGVGVRLRDAAGNPMLNAVGEFCRQGISTIQAGGAFNFTGTWELVRTNAPLATSGTLTVQDGQWVFGVYNTGVQLNSDPVNNTNNSSIYPSGNISVKSLTCQVSSPSTVNLAAVGLNEIKSVGSTARAVGFNLGLRCDSAAIVGITFDASVGTPIKSVTNGVFGVQNEGRSGMASGVGVQLVSAASSAPVPLQQRIPLGTIAANVQNNYPYQFRYYRTAQTAVPGRVSGAMIFTFDYQ